MFDTEVKFCPIYGKQCIANKCSFWKQSAYDFYTFTGDLGSCKFDLALNAVIEKFGNDEEGRFQYNEHDFNTNKTPKVPFKT